MTEADLQLGRVGTVVGGPDAGHRVLIQEVPQEPVWYLVIVCTDSDGPFRSDRDFGCRTKSQVVERMHGQSWYEIRWGEPLTW